MVNHSCHNGAHSNGCPAQRTSPFNPFESLERPVCLKRQVGLDFLWKNSGQEWMRSLYFPLVSRALNDDASEAVCP